MIWVITIFSTLWVFESEALFKTSGFKVSDKCFDKRSVVKYKSLKENNHENKQEIETF